MNDINTKIESLLKKIYTDGNESSYYKAAELAYNLFEDKNSWIRIFFEKLKVNGHSPIVGR